MCGGHAMVLMHDFGLHLGVHRLTIGQGGIDQALITARQKKFYSSFSVNVLLSVYIGRSPTFRPASIDLQIPPISPEIDFNSFPNYRSSVFHWETKLVLIAAIMMTKVYSMEPLSSAERRAAVSDIHLALESWYHELPAHLRAATTVASRAPQTMIIGLNIQYFMIMVHLHRPFFRRINAGIPADNISTQKCLYSVDHIVRLIKLQKEAHGLRLTSPAFQHACFSTGTILALSAIEDHISETIEKDKDRRAQAEILLKLLTAALREMGTTWGTAFTSAAVIDGLMAQWSSSSTTIPKTASTTISKTTSTITIPRNVSPETEGTRTAAAGDFLNTAPSTPFWPPLEEREWNNVDNSFPFMFPSWDQEPLDLDRFMTLLNSDKGSNVDSWTF